MKTGDYVWRSLGRFFRALLRRLEGWWKRRVTLPQPGPLTVRELQRNGTMGLRYEAVLPEVPTGTDIVKQKLTIDYEGGHEEMDLALDAGLVQFVVNAQNVTVVLSLVYVDDADNVSEPKTTSFMASDTIAPDAPGDFGAITLIGEE